MTKCALCGKDGVALLQASHRDLGTILICSECWQTEWHRLLSLGGGSSGGCCG